MKKFFLFFTFFAIILSGIVYFKTFVSPVRRHFATLYPSLDVQSKVKGV